MGFAAETCPAILIKRNRETGLTLFAPSKLPPAMIRNIDQGFRLHYLLAVVKDRDRLRRTVSWGRVGYIRGSQCSTLCLVVNLAFVITLLWRFMPSGFLSSQN